MHSSKETTMKYAPLLLAIALAGCTAMQGQMAADSEQILAEAGFQRQPFDEPGLPARRLVLDGVSYKFADPDYCRCTYVGGAKEYAELQRLRAQRIADHDWYIRRTNAAHHPDPNAWAAWRPEGLDAVTAPVAASDTKARPASN
jgi:hypothetical protein